MVSSVPSHAATAQHRIATRHLRDYGGQGLPVPMHVGSQQGWPAGEQNWHAGSVHDISSPQKVVNLVQSSGGSLTLSQSQRIFTSVQYIEWPIALGTHVVHRRPFQLHSNHW
jgi:hypothetical protein